MRSTDPFPITYQGLQPTHQLDWPAMAHKVIRDVLQLQRHERVILSASPYCGGAMLEAVRAEIQRARAIEQATIVHWTPALTELRTKDGAMPNPEDAAAEDRAIAELFGLADVYVWLQNDWRLPRSPMTVGQSERILETWNGRGLHFHWFHDPNNPDPDWPPNKAIDLVYQDAVLNLDYPALKRTMLTLERSFAEQEIRITNPAGTDLKVQLTRKFHKNFGDASKARQHERQSARDREEEIPCGCFRTIPVQDSVNGTIAFAGSFGFPAYGFGLDFDPFIAKGLRIHFADGRIRRLETGGDQAALDRLWAEQTGDKDRLGEIVLGCNPLLRPVDGSGFPPYYGFGEGYLRLTIGENVESGGTNRSSLHRWLFLLDATITVGGKAFVEGGKLTPAAHGV